MSDELIWYWHVHHEVLIEPLSKSADERRGVIKRSKLASERATRLLWMQPVLDPDSIPRAVVDVVKRWPQSSGEGWEPSTDALEDMKRAVLKCKGELRALHDRELPLAPWDWDNMRMIFPGEKPVDEVCAGYNPYKLRESCVGAAAGWRLLTEDEIGLRKPRSEIEMWSNDGQRWLSGGFRGCDGGATYRTTLPYPLPKE